MATFITSKSVGQDINIYVNTSTGYWKYNHNGSDSSVFSSGNQTITVTNVNGEFTIIPCLSNGTVSGDITTLYLASNQLTSFDGTGISSLTELGLQNNQLTSFDGTGLTSLTYLDLGDNQLTTIDVSSLTNLTELQLQNNQLTSFDGTGFTSLVYLSLMGNQLTSLDVSPMTSLANLYLADSYGTLTNPITPSANDSILNQLVINNLSGGGKGGPMFSSANGRTATSNVDYNTLLDRGWNLLGLDLVEGGGGGVNVTGKLRIKGATTISTPSSPLFTNITLGGIISFGPPDDPGKTSYYRQLTFDYDSTILAANMDEGSTYEIVMITTSNYFSENTITGISSMDIGGTTYYRGNAHKVGVQGVGAKGSVTILTAQWSNSNPNTLIVDTPNNVVGNYTPFTLTTWRFALIKDGNYVNGTLSSQSFLGSELDAS